MAYRDELEALRAHVDRLEGENAALRRENGELRGGAADERASTNGWLGGPVRVEVERRVEGELPPGGYEHVVEVLRERFGMLGETSVLGSTLTWKIGRPHGSRTVEVTITAREGRTRVRVVERLGDLAGGLFGGIVGGVGGGGLGAVIPLGVLVDPLLALVLAPAWVGAVYAIVRAGYARTSQGREREIHAVALALEDAIHSSIAQSRTRVRVTDASETGDPRESDDAHETHASERDGAQRAGSR